MSEIVACKEVINSPKAEGLRSRVLRGGVWLVVADVANRGLGLVKMAVLVRLLAPEDFGLMGMALLILGWFDMFSQTGFATALIRKSGDVRPYLGTFWTVQVLRGIFLAAILFVGAPVVGWVFHTPAVVAIVRAISVVAVLKGAANPAVIYLRRELRMEREVIWRVGGNFAGLLVAVPFAVAYRSVWALVVAALTANIAELALSYWVVPHRPRFEIDREKAREMIRFGKWIFWSNIAFYLSMYSDGWAVGWFLGGIPLGYYQIAQQFGMTPLASFGSHITAVGLPAFSKLRDRASLRSAYLRSIRFSSTALFPLGALAMAFADTAVRVVLGEKWVAVCPILPLLVWAGILTAISGVSTAFLQARDQPNQFVWAAFLKFASFATLCYPMMQLYGLKGIAFATMISAPISFCYLYARVASVLGWGWDLLLVFRPALLACTPALAALAMVHLSLPLWLNVMIAGAAGLACAALAGQELWSLSRHAS